MEIKRIYAENYKTYRHLDLNLEGCDEERPIILIGGMNITEYLKEVVWK